MHIALKAAVGDKSINDFYPTPKALAREMLKKVNLRSIDTILEPSAGKGDLIEMLDDGNNGWRRRSHDIECVEIDPALQSILKDKHSGAHVVGSDFLRFHTFKKYDLILMNPPFSEGDKHLLKAIAMQKRYGGQIVCLLNAETLRNQHTNTRKDLAKQLADLNADIEYKIGAFEQAERKSSVEIAIIHIDIPAPERISDIYETLKADTRNYATEEEPEVAISHADYCEHLVAQYNLEIRCGLKLIAEYRALAPHIAQKVGTDEGGKPHSPILELRVDDREARYADVENAYAEKTRLKYWEAILYNREFMDRLTSNLQKEYHGRLQELAKMEFSMENINAIKREMLMNVVRGVEQTILDLFNKFSHEHYYQGDGSDTNVHYYNGWKTNKCWIINKKIIRPAYKAFDTYSGKFKPTWYEMANELRDIERVFDYLDMGRTCGWSDIYNFLRRAEDEGQTRKIDTKYFLITFYKKGTMHLEFKDLELLKKFNIFGSQRKNWLPPSYGKAQYADMDAESKAVIDEFEGRESYEMTMAEKDYFIMDHNSLLMLAGGQGEGEWQTST